MTVEISSGVEITLKVKDNPCDLRKAAEYLVALAEHRAPSSVEVTPTIPTRGAVPAAPPAAPTAPVGFVPPKPPPIPGVSTAQAGENLASAGRASVSTAQAGENLASYLTPAEAPVTSVPTGLVPRVEAPSVETDKSGTPWDERIHAGTKVKTADGNWRKRRGLPEGEYERVVAEIRPSHALAETHPDLSLSETPPAEPAQAKTFAELADYVTKRLAAGTLNNEQLLDCCPDDVTMFTAMASRTEAEIIETFNNLRLI